MTKDWEKLRKGARGLPKSCERSAVAFAGTHAFGGAKLEQVEGGCKVLGCRIAWWHAHGAARGLRGANLMELGMDGEQEEK